MDGKEEVDYRFQCEEDGCGYGTNRVDTFKLHKLSVHTAPEDVNWFHCTKEGCNSKFISRPKLNYHVKKVHGDREFHCPHADCNYAGKEQKALDVHIHHTHNENADTFKCDFEGCESKFKSKSILTRHKLTHTDEKTVDCTEEGCDSKFKTAAELKSHLARVHNQGEKNINCDVENCDYVCLTKSDLRSHKLHIHKIGVKQVLKCDVEGCDKEFLKPQTLKQHRADAHNIDVVWRHCEHKDCDFKAKQLNNLKRHMASVHQINARTFVCDVEGCDTAVGEKWKLKTHKEEHHNMGKYQCGFCLQNRNTTNKYKDAQGKHNICNVCYKAATGQSTRIETEMSEYLDKHVGEDYLLGSDKSLKAMGGCQLYRPDKLYTSPDLVIVVECDEHQHKYSNGDYRCDEKRISDIFDEFDGKTMVVIRWNPHAYKPIKGKKLGKKERLERLVKLYHELCHTKHDDPIHIYYMWYDANNPRIAVNIPYTMIL